MIFKCPNCNSILSNARFSGIIDKHGIVFLTLDVIVGWVYYINNNPSAIPLKIHYKLSDNLSQEIGEIILNINFNALGNFDCFTTCINCLKILSVSHRINFHSSRVQEVRLRHIAPSVTENIFSTFLNGGDNEVNYLHKYFKLPMFSTYHANHNIIIPKPSSIYSHYWDKILTGLNNQFINMVPTFTCYEEIKSFYDRHCKIDLSKLTTEELIKYKELLI